MRIYPSSFWVDLWCHKADSRHWSCVADHVILAHRRPRSRLSTKLTKPSVRSHPWYPPHASLVFSFFFFSFAFLYDGDKSIPSQDQPLTCGVVVGRSSLSNARLLTPKTLSKCCSHDRKPPQGPSYHLTRVDSNPCLFFCDPFWFLLLLGSAT